MEDDRFDMYLIKVYFNHLHNGIFLLLLAEDF